MSGTLKTKQWVPLSDDEREVLQAEAQRRDMTVGLLARSLLLYGLERIDSAGVARQIDEERAATKRRISDGARAAAHTRWGTDDEGSRK